jgi:hypothetical protein
MQYTIDTNLTSCVYWFRLPLYLLGKAKESLEDTFIVNWIQQGCNIFQVRRINSKNTLCNDSRSVQHRLATNRIQQEIDEATEREKELREAGMIQTMSEDTVDSKVWIIIHLFGKSMSFSLPVLVSHSSAFFY